MPSHLREVVEVVDVGRLRQEMAYVSAILFSSGATLVLVGAVLDAWPGQDAGPMLTVVVIAYVTAGALAVAARQHVIPMWVFEVLAALGTLLVSVVVLAGGPEASAVYAILYVYVAAYVFYYFPPPMAIAQMVLAAVAYAVVLRILDPPGAVAEWIVIVSAAAISGGLIGGLGNRARKLLDQEQDAAVRLRELDDMKTTFLQAVSHELRTPLTNLQGYAVTLQRHHDELEAERVTQIVDRLVHNADRLSRLLSDLLEVDRLSRGIVEARLSPTDLGTLVTEVVDHFDAGMHPVHLRAERVVVPVDAPKVERIVENLLANAAKHTPAGTPLHVGVRPADGGVLLTVEDEGPGVSDDLKAKVFEPFEQGPTSSRAPSPGTGIGLALVARFTQLHGGRTWVEDREDGGARFNVFLPEEPAADAALRIH